MEFEIGFSIALLILLAIGIPFYFYSNIQSQKLKFISFGYYMLCILVIVFISMHFREEAPEIFQISPSFSGFFSVLSLPIFFFFSCRVRKKENLAFSELRKIAILLPYIYAIAPVMTASVSYIFIALFNSEFAFGLTLGGGYLAAVMWLPASVFLVIFMIFIYTKSKETTPPKTLSTSE